MERRNRNRCRNGNSINVNARIHTYSDDRSLLVCEGSTKKSYSSPNDCLFMLCLEIGMSELGAAGCRSFFSAPLCFQLEGHADLVSALVEVLAVDDRRQGEGDA